jgi:hemolysin activation/secretion protein
MLVPIRPTVRLFLALALSILMRGAWAAALPPGAPTPGEVQSTLPTAPVLPQPKAVPLVNTPPPVTGTVPPGGPTVTVQKFVITGNTAFSEATLQAEIASYLGQDLTLAELYKVADTLTRYYQSHGYGLARATLPEQELSGGTVTLQVIEGRIGRLSVEGATRTRTMVIEHQASGLKTGDVYTDAGMDRSVLLVNDLPGVEAQVVLQPGTEFGTADIVYKVEEAPEYSGQVSVDDYGRKDTGRWRLNASADAAGITGSGDRLTANLTHSEGNLLNFGGLTYSLPLGTPGARLTASYSQSKYRVTGPVFGPLELSGSSKNGNLTYLYPEIRSRTESLYFGVGLDHAGGRSDVKGQTVSGSQINLLQLIANYTLFHEDGSALFLNGGVDTNLHVNDNAQSSQEFARLNVGGGYLKPLGGQWTLFTRGGAQWSPDPLADTEKYSLGGPDNVRGFNSADARGDSGVFLSFELQRTLAPAWPLTAGGFVESGKVWSKRFLTPLPACVPNLFSDCVTPAEAHTLTSVGVELLFQSEDKRWNSRLQWAYAVGGTKPADGNELGHIWLSVGMSF